MLLKQPFPFWFIIGYRIQLYVESHYGIDEPRYSLFSSINGITQLQVSWSPVAQLDIVVATWVYRGLSEEIEGKQQSPNEAWHFGIKRSADGFHSKELEQCYYLMSLTCRDVLFLLVFALSIEVLLCWYIYVYNLLYLLIEPRLAR